MESFKGIAVSLFGWVIDKHEDTFKFVKEWLPRADIRMTVRSYVSIMFFAAAITFMSSILALSLALRIVTVSVIMKVALFIFVPLLTSVATVVILMFYPYQKATTRKKNIESNLPFVLTHMGAIAESGVPPYVIFRLVAEFEEYGEVSYEMKKIVRNIEQFGINPIKAVKEIARRTPSDELKQILFGFVTTTESGGDVKVYLKNAGQQALFEWRMKRERFLQQLSAYAEFYTGILIAAPLFIIALFSVMNMIPGGGTMAGYNIFFLTQLSVYLLIPGLNIFFLVFLRGMEVEM
jgi:flagellar protein FlaJ